MNRRRFVTTLPALAGAARFSPPARAAAPGRPRLRSAICCYSYRTELARKTMTYDDVVRVAVENGIDALDMTVYWFPNTSDEFLLPLKRLAYRNAVPIYGISVRTEMTKPTPELQEKELAGLRQWVDVAEKLGAGHIRVFGGKVPRGATEEQAAGWVIEVLKRGAEYAGKKGVILGLENHGGITEKAETIIKIVKAVDSPWVAVNVDTGNFNRNAYQQLEAIIPYAANVQVKANIRPGADGAAVESDWDRIAGMLVKSGYRGHLALEYEEKEPAPAAMPRMLAKLRQIVLKHSA
jgi:sugar phosphate isomerase/epimerase